MYVTQKVGDQGKTRRDLRPNKAERKASSHSRVVSGRIKAAEIASTDSLSHVFPPPALGSAVPHQGLPFNWLTRPPLTTVSTKVFLPSFLPLEGE